MRGISIYAGLFLSAMALPAAEPALALKVENAAPPAAVRDAVKEVLAPEAFIIRATKGEILMRLWLRAEVPMRATPEQVKNGLTYHEIPATTLVGVVEFPNTFVDFRKQEIPSGTFTLRFALQPETGDHLGVSPHREFLLLTPAEKDKSTDLIEPKVLIERSAEVINGDHPTVMMLFPERGKVPEAVLVDRGDGVQVLKFTRKAATAGGPASLGFAVTVQGHVKE